MNYIKIDDFYSEEELSLIWEELKFLTYSHKLDPPQKTGQQNPTMKKNDGIFLDSVYTDRNISNILKVNRKVFTKDVMKKYNDLSEMHENIFNCNSDTTLISYYENNGFYKSHKDNAVITALTWFFKEPRMFEGGDLIFSKSEEKIEVKNNTLIIFPSHMNHQVTSVKMDGKAFSGNGRYCMSQFLSIK
jgi:predicted 2-oxoglutarate/Fe(II)-dependent dioxygenase YbiX